MKLSLTTIWVLISMGLTSCGIGPHQMNGVSGRERTEYLNSIKPYGAHWIKEGMTKEEQRNDWVNCGGDRSGTFSPSIQTLSDGEKAGFSREQIRRRLESEADSCMVNRGYRFVRD
jgi:hypothetical protein